MPVHDDHRGNDEAHVLSLRLALGSILSPKRPQYTRSSTNSGTASPATHCPHSSIPLSPAHSNSSAHPSTLAPPPSHSAQPHLNGQHPHYPHGHQHGHSHLNPDRDVRGQPVMPHTDMSHALDETHPNIPDAVAAPVSTVASTPGNMTPNARAHFVETLQNKTKSWDALIHGSWV
ncbi:hypothetical protein L227DRAFT_39596 [Lentinus tigrinus ALCF2SS1-6]|uniref:Uncharacterized protein n=1 Tax=Lentinus tigrinus ALCF2SS1-6 TaxID=1328759 RepID=A0A5C2RPX7_9APHY|nr:hypothetical protein L227DRAFT_39596 [Lentinus tigrinus ALCF2SS1-6]